MQLLDEIAIRHGTDKSSVHHGYTRVYSSLFGEIREKPIRLLEIGVQFGFSINTWLDYFPKGKIYGIDISNDFKCDDPRYAFIQADQGNVVQMLRVAESLRPLDIVIDDGCHRALHVIASFNALWPILVSGGYYIIEDCFTFWHPAFASELDGPKWLAQFIGDVNLHGKDFYGMPYPNPVHSKSVLGPLELTLESIFFTKGLVVLRKK